MLLGPDQIVQTDSTCTWHINGATKLSLDPNSLDFLEPESVPSFVQRVCRQAPDHIAYKVKENGKWVGTTYTEYFFKIKCTARAFLKLGLERYHSVAVSSSNCPEYFLSILGCQYAGSIVSSITKQTP